jgi:hypothetical protein
VDATTSANAAMQFCTQIHAYSYILFAYARRDIRGLIMQLPTLVAKSCTPRLVNNRKYGSHGTYTSQYSKSTGYRGKWPNEIDYEESECLTTDLSPQPSKMVFFYYAPEETFYEDDMLTFRPRFIVDIRTTQPSQHSHTPAGITVAKQQWWAKLRLFRYKVT